MLLKWCRNVSFTALTLTVFRVFYRDVKRHITHRNHHAILQVEECLYDYMLNGCHNNYGPILKNYCAKQRHCLQKANLIHNQITVQDICHVLTSSISGFYEPLVFRTFGYIFLSVGGITLLLHHVIYRRKKIKPKKEKTANPYQFVPGCNSTQKRTYGTGVQTA